MYPTSGLLDVSPAGQFGLIWEGMDDEDQGLGCL